MSKLSQWITTLLVSYLHTPNSWFKVILEMLLETPYTIWPTIFFSALEQLKVLPGLSQIKLIKELILLGQKS